MIYLIALTLLLAPAYTVRFELFNLPTNLLMLWVFFVCVVFGVYLTVKKEWADYIHFKLSLDKKNLFWLLLFLLAGTFSLFWQGFTLEKFGQFIVLFIQPVSLFIIASFIWLKNPDSKRLLLAACYLLLALMGIYSVMQYFTLFGLPPAYWGNSVEPKRALGFFEHPNFYSLFSAPLLALLIPDLGRGIKYIKITAWMLGAIGLLLSLSRAGWLGLGVAGLVYLFVTAEKKIRKLAFVSVIIIVIVIISVPNLRWRFALPFYGEKSAVSRISLWTTGWKAVKESPIFGLGLTGFAKNWDRLNADPNIDTHNFPHNIFLNFWVELGVIGLISLIGLTGLIIYKGMVHRTDAFKLGVALFLITLVAQGLIDNPYFKNDLALIFWVVLSLNDYENADKKIA